MKEFEWYEKEIETRKKRLVTCSKLAVHTADISDYWYFVRIIEKLRQEIYTLEQMAREKGIYPVGEN